jgi:purine-binding chemotaxis protein CheW
LASPSTPDSLIPQQIVVFSLGEEEYGLPITQVQEIIRHSEPRAVASHVAWMRGVISLRGQIIPVIDLAARLGLSGSGTDEPGKIIIVETENSNAGIVVDEVQEVLTLKGDDTEPLPTAGNDALQAIAKIGDRLVVLLDARGLFGDTELGIAA